MATYKNEPEPEDQLYFPDRASWRAWLEENHETRDSIWLIFHKKSSATTSIDYESAVLEALCFGWVDSKVHGIDEERYRQYFSKRKPRGNWNGVNKRRVAELTKSGLMAPAGFAAIEVAKANGAWEFLDDIEALIVPDDLDAALRSQKGAAAHFEELSNSKKQLLLYWIKSAKRDTTRADRIAKAADAAARGELPSQLQA